MIKFVLKIFFVSVTSFAYASFGMEEVLSIVRETRPHGNEDSDSPLLLAREDAAIEMLSDALLDFTSDNLQTSLSTFVLHSLSYLVPPGDFILKEKSKWEKKRELLYYIADKGKTPLVVKLFPLTNERWNICLHELSSMEFFASLGLEKSKTIHPLAMGKLTYEKTPYLCVALSLAPGKEIHQYRKNLLDATSPLERDMAAALLQKALYRLGEVLGEWHAKSLSWQPHPTQRALEMICARQRKVFYSLKEKTSPLVVERLGKIFRRELEAFKNAPFPLTYHHGDARGSNFFYEEENDRLTVIDLPSSHTSFNSDGSPEGFYALDLSLLEEQMEDCLSYGIPKESVEAIIASFWRGYTNTNPQLPLKAHLEICRTVAKLQRLKDSMNWEKEENERKQQIRKNALDRTIDYFLEKDGLQRKVRLKEIFNGTP